MSAQPPHGPPTSPPPGYPSGRSDRGLAIVVAVIALVIVGGVAYWLGGRNSSSPTATGSSPPVATSPPSASAGPSAPPSTAPSAAPSASPSASVAPAPATTSAAPTTTARTTSASPSPTVTPFTHPDPDFGYVTAVTTSGSVTKLSFDRATLETGPAAASAAAAHGQTVEDDYFIVNDNPLIRTFELSPSVVVTGSSNLSGAVGPKPSTLAALEAWVTTHPKVRLPVNLSYDASGKVTKVAEQFFP